MDVENFRRKLLHEPGRKQAHVTGEADEIDFAVQESRHNFAVVLLAWPAFRWNDERMESALAGGFQTGSIGTVRNHDSNAGGGDPARRNTVGDGHKIGSASGKKEAEMFHSPNIIHPRGTTKSQ